MMCPKCRAAGQVLRTDPEAAKVLHEQCKGYLGDSSQCTCQHSLASQLLGNRAAVR